MSIFPSTDLIAEVAGSANPQRQSAAMAKLSALSSGGAAVTKGFDSFVSSGPATSIQADLSPKAFELQGGVSSPSSFQPSLSNTGSSAPTLDALKKFEAFVIQVSLETLLPKEGHGAYGVDSAGGVWRSMMAEQLGTQIEKGGGLGLQRILGRYWSEQIVHTHSSGMAASNVNAPTYGRRQV